MDDTNPNATKMLDRSPATATTAQGGVVRTRFKHRPKKCTLKTKAQSPRVKSCLQTLATGSRVLTEYQAHTVPAQVSSWGCRRTAREDACARSTASTHKRPSKWVWREKPTWLQNPTRPPIATETGGRGQRSIGRFERQVPDSSGGHVTVHSCQHSEPHQKGDFLLCELCLNELPDKTKDQGACLGKGCAPAAEHDTGRPQKILGKRAAP